MSVVDSWDWEKISSQEEPDDVVECCETCNYFCEVRKWPVYDEVLTHICINPLIVEGYVVDYICEASANDRCELWEEREGLRG